jgi:hypothetical protein
MNDTIVHVVHNYTITPFLPFEKGNPMLTIHEHSCYSSISFLLFKTNTITMPRVTFPEKEASSIHTYQRLDIEHVQDLFYQPEDFIRFRAEYRVFKTEQARRERLYHMNSMAAQDRNKLQQKQQLKMNILPGFEQQQRRQSHTVRCQPHQTRGFALMA